MNIPVVPLNGPTLRANAIVVQYAPVTGGITLFVVDQRQAPVSTIGEAPKFGSFEIGRFELTPRALRALLDTGNAAAAAYKAANGHDLPTAAQFDARGAMPGLENLLSSPRPPESEGK